MASATAQMLEDAARDDEVRQAVLNRIDAPLIPGNNRMSQEDLEVYIAARKLTPEQEQARYDAQREALTREYAEIRRRNAE